MIIAAEYDDNGALINIKIKALDEADADGTITIRDIEADKVFVWNTLDTAQPLCGAAEVKKNR